MVGTNPPLYCIPSTVLYISHAFFQIFFCQQHFSSMEFHPKCPLPLLQLEGSERKNINGTNTLLAIFRDQKRVEITVKAFLPAKNLFFMKKFIFFWKSVKMHRSIQNLKINQNVGMFQRDFKMIPQWMDGFNCNVQRDLGCTEMGIIVKVFLYENHRQTSTIHRQTMTVNGWHFWKTTNQNIFRHFWTSNNGRNHTPIRVCCDL